MLMYTIENHIYKDYLLDFIAKVDYVIQLEQKGK